MILRNQSRYQTLAVRRIVTFATEGLDMRNVCVKVKNANNKPFRGMAYDHVPAMASMVPLSARYLVTIGIGGSAKFPELGHRYPGMTLNFPMYDILDWKEALVITAAHEALHVEQFREGLPRSELKAERYAVRRLEAWREENTCQ